MSIAGKPKLIRKINRGLLIEVLREKQLMTNTELAKKTNLSRRTINLIITSLKETGIVSEHGYGNSTNEGGKKPIIYKFNPNAFYLIGIVVRDYKISIGVCNLNGQIFFEDSISANWQNGNESTILQIVKLVKGIINKSEINFSKFLGIGIGLPGLVDFTDGSIRHLTRHKGWENIQLSKILNEEIGINVEIDNENCVRALGEKWFGIAKKINNFVTIMTSDEGIGCGVVINNKLLRSHNSLLGEVGHIKINENDKKFRDLNNFEYFLGIKHINDLVILNRNLKSFSKSPLSNSFTINSSIKMEDLFINYNLGDEFANVIIEKLSDYFTLLINIIFCTYDPELLIIHGKFSMLDDKFFGKISGSIKEFIFPKLKKKIVIKKSLQSREMAILGAAGMVLDGVSI